MAVIKHDQSVNYELKKMIRKDMRKIDEQLQNRDKQLIEDLITKLSAVYGNEITDFHAHLNTYLYRNLTIDQLVTDLEIIKEKLQFYLAKNVGVVKHIQKHDDKTNNISINNYQNSFQNQSSNLTVILSISELRSEISNIGTLPQNKIDELLEKLNDLESVFSEDIPRPQKWKKIKPIIDWLMNQGVDIFIKIMPTILDKLIK